MNEFKINTRNPFEWGVDEEKKYISVPTQRNASYTETVQNDYHPDELAVFGHNEQAPTTPLACICGIECPEEGNGDDSGDNNTTGGETGGDGNNG